MVVAFESYWLSVSDVVDHLDAVSCFGDSESFAGEYLLIAFGVEFSESLAEFEFAAVDHDGSISSLLTLYCVFWQGVGVDAQEVTYSCSFKFEISCHSVVA